MSDSDLTNASFKLTSDATDVFAACEATTSKSHRAGAGSIVRGRLRVVACDIGEGEAVGNASMEPAGNGPRAIQVVRGKKERIPTGCEAIDRVLRGGVPCGSVTEIVGESTAGKSQICMQLLLALQRPKSLGGLGGKSLYIHTEGEPPLKRLKKISEAWVKEGWLPNDSVCFDNLYMENSIRSTEDLCSYLLKVKALLERDRSEEGRVKLIIIDSIAYLFRDIDGKCKDEVMERSGLLFQVGALLKRYADNYNISVIVTNHVVDVVDKKVHQAIKEQNTGGFRSFLSSGRRVVPALGLSWANCVNTRLFVSRRSQGSQRSNVRDLQIVFAPHLPAGLSCSYTIGTGGLISYSEDLEEGDIHVHQDHPMKRARIVIT